MKKEKGNKLTCSMFKLNDANGLSLGCALIESIQTERYSDKLLLNILKLLNICFQQSTDVRNIFGSTLRQDYI